MPNSEGRHHSAAIALASATSGSSTFLLPIRRPRKFPKRSISTKMTGVMNSVSSCETTRPPTTAMPSGWRSSELAPVPIDDLAYARSRHTEHAREHDDGVVQVLGVFADDGNAVGVPVLDQRPALAIEHDPTRRAQRERTLVVVLGHLLELLVLHDLQHPEAHREHREHDRGEVLENAQPHSDAATVLVLSHQQNTRMNSRTLPT